MSNERPSSRWQIMQDGKTFYKRQQLYSIPGKLPNLSDYIVAGCRYGGPIALMRDTTKLVALGRVTPAFTKAQIQIYSPAGEGLLLFSWEQAKIIRFGWTANERLVILNEEGIYRLYDLQGDYQQYSLGSEAGEMGVIDARIHENGLVALTGSLTLLEVKGWEGGRPLTLANPALVQPPSSWAIIPPDLNISRHVEVLLSVDSTILSVDNLESVDQRLSHGPFTHVSPSPNGKSLALLTFSGTLLVVSSDFQRTLAEFKTGDVAGAEGSVRQVEWCGIDAIIVTWDNLVVVVGPFGDTLEYSYSGPTFVVTEPDGVRVMGPDVCDLIQKVPTSSASIFRPGSTSASAILYDAWESFSQRSPKADENIRSIRPELAAAVDECIDAAGQEWEPYWQRRLLNAAKFGRGFLDLHNPTDFVNMGQILKVLNAVRFYEIGIPLTHLQYIYTSPSHLITRLTARNMHLLALRISTFLSIKPDAVLKHWASAKIMRSRPSATGTGAEADLGGDEDVCKLIVDKFEQLGGADVSYADIAKRAWEVGRGGLATKLLDHEPRASDQVPLLLTMKEDRLALVKAVDSGDTDLVYHVLLHLHKRLPLGSFFRLIEDGGSQLAPASKLLQVYAREQNREMLRDFFYSDDRRVESAVLSLDEAASILNPASKVTAIRAAQKFFSEDKDRGFESKMMDESARLLTFQQQLERESDGKIIFFGLSVNETIRTCLLNGMSKRADKVKSDFKVPDKRFWYVKLQALITIGDFEGLDTFSKSKRSPIGYEPFVRHLVETGHSKEALAYVVRCDSPKRADLYVECGEWRMAGKECKERNDKAKLEAIRQNCPNSLIAREFDQILASMK
ncbi:vacuolar assembling sorting protein VPS16 [Mycena rebaudengoi]|nr:vacuolar assembling sorting protein VPS16 [Mycena rebaudengoi]